MVVGIEDNIKSRICVPTYDNLIDNIVISMFLTI